MRQSLLNEYKKIAVVGGGLMGGGIAHVFAEKGFQVVVVDLSVADLEKCKVQITKMTNRLGQDLSLLNNITFTTKIEDAQEADFAIEAVPEKLEIKLDVFRKLDALLPSHGIIASNTSSLSIAAMSSVTKRPSQVAGMHFFSPVPVMKLVEIVKGINTSEETVKKIVELSHAIGKETIIAKDYPGFNVNRMLVPMINEAAYLVMEGNDPEEIDRGMMLGANHPIGPLKLADAVGIDVLYYTALSLYEGFNDSKYRPCPLLKRMVEAGHLGKKTGKGFYDYGGAKK